MSEQLSFAGLPVSVPAEPMKPMQAPIPVVPAMPVPKAKRIRPTMPPAAATEIATVEKGDFLGEFSTMEYPNQSPIVRDRSQGRGLRIYDQMMLTDADLSGLFDLLFDDVLHFPAVITAASKDPDHLAHAQFLKFAVRYVPHLQNALRHFLDSYARGFSVTEKIYEVVPRGEFAGAVVWADLLDKPARWFSFDKQRNLRFRTIKNFYPGEPVNQTKFIVTRFGTNSDAWGEPMLDFCYWPWVLRHQAMKNQAIFFDKWAVPTAKVEFEVGTGLNAEATTSANRAAALRVAQAIQNDQSIAVPKGMLLGLIESARNGSISFDNYLSELWQVMSRRITGQILAGSGEKGGSYALGKVHAEAKANKVEMLATFISAYFSRELRELIDLNFGPQDVYPSWQILARDLVDKQAWLEVEQLAISNGHQVSKSWSDYYLQTVLPDGQDDLLTPSATPPPAQAAINPSLAADDGVRLAAMKHHALHQDAKAKAMKVRKHLDGVAAKATGKAKPAIKKVVSTLADSIRKKKSVKSVTKKSLIKGISGYVPGLAPIFDGMISGATTAPTSLADGQDSSDAAKIAEALTMYAIVESIADRAADAPEDMSAEDFANSLLDENATSDSVVNAQSAIFDNIHGTNIASMATGALRQKLADPAYRKANPYVMIVVKPGARSSHQLMDGHVISSEEAEMSPLLPPFDFGCDCIAVPISEATAQEMGLTGARPTGAPPRSGVTAPGFAPAFAQTDMQSQLSALREKAAELQTEDPEAWAAMSRWLVILLGFDVLQADPPSQDDVQ